MAFDQGLPVSHWQDMGIPPTHVEAVDELYRLVAIDSHGREWRSSPVRGRFSALADVGGRGEVVESIDTLSYRDLHSRDDDPSVVLIFPTPPPVRFPLSGWTRQVHARHDEEVLMCVTADHHQYQTEGCDVRIEHGNDDPLVVVVTPLDAEMVPWGFERRLLDALAFAFGRGFLPPLSLRTQAKHTDWYVCRGPYLDPQGMVRPPVLPTSGADHMSVWSLAAAYQNSIVREWPEASSVHDPLSAALAEIAIGSRGTFRSAALALAIGVEAIGNAIRLRERHPPKVQPSLQMDSFVEYVQRWEGDQTTRDFVLNRLAQLKSPDLASCLYAFADAKNVDHAVIKTWKTMRPKLAHGALVDSYQQSPDDKQREAQMSIDLYYAVLGLVYRMIADFIGYDGPLVDYFRPDWGLLE